jgi:hypothetical protein
MKSPLIIIRNEYDGKEMHINVSNIDFIKPAFEGGYEIFFTSKQILKINYKEYELLKKAFEGAAENA